MMIGLILGSFDPIHIGHLAVATLAWNSGEFDEIWIIPALSNPWKTNQTSFKHRYRMVQLALKGYKNIIASPYESFYHNSISSRSPNSMGTCYVLDDIKERFPDKEFRLITTAETYSEIPNWTEGDRVMEQWGESAKLINSVRFKDVTDPLQAVSINISSTDIRKILRENKNPLPYIPSNIYNYIIQNKLYQ